MGKHSTWSRDSNDPFLAGGGEVERDDDVEGTKGGDAGFEWGGAGDIIVETGGEETDAVAGDA